MSIEQLKKILESEIKKESDSFCICCWKCGNDGTCDNGKCQEDIKNIMRAATNRLLPLIQKAVEILNFYADKNNWGADHNTMENRWVYSIINENDLDQELNGGKRAREFLSEFTKMTEIKKENK